MRGLKAGLLMLGKAWAVEVIEGITGQFKRVSDEFTKRMGTNRALTNRFGMLYAQG